MNCFPLDDEDYVNYITEKISISCAEGREVLSASRSIWDWLKCKVRAHTIQSSKEEHGRETKENKIFKKNTLKRSLLSKQTLTIEMQILCSCFMK